MHIYAYYVLLVFTIYYVPKIQNMCNTVRLRNACSNFFYLINDRTDLVLCIVV